MNQSKVILQNHSDSYDHDHDHDHYDDDHEHDHCPHHHHHCHHDEDDDELDSGDDSLSHVRHSTPYRSSPHSPRSSRASRYGTKNTGSGPDGYEAFENTNNKKKRKIPTSGSLSLHHSTLTNDLAHLGINGGKNGASDDPYYASAHSGGASGLGVQGAGRGRNSRKLPGRNPLSVSVNGTNARTGSSKYDQNMSTNAKGKSRSATSGSIGTDKNSRRIERPRNHFCCNRQCYSTSPQTSEQRSGECRRVRSTSQTCPYKFTIHFYL